jgi:hypothetical protein
MLPNLRFQAPTSPSAPASASILAPSMPPPSCIALASSW